MWNGKLPLIPTIDDMLITDPPPGLDHPWDDVAAAKEGAFEVETDRLIPHGHVHVRSDPVSRLRATSTVEQDRERPEFRLGECDGTFDTFLVGDVGLNEQGFAARCAELLSGAGTTVRIDLRDGHAGALASEDLGRRPGDPRARPSDERHFPVQPSHGPSFQPVESISPGWRWAWSTTACPGGGLRFHQVAGLWIVP